ncbi:MAG: dihydrolipoamide acetyltransferase family protein [Eubacteriales bacterium]
MANVVNMPQIGLNETSNLISTWNKKEGEPVQIGDVLFSIETDKSSMEVESEFEGILLKQLYEEGDACDVLVPVCIIGQQGEDISDLIHSKDTSTLSEEKEKTVVLKDEKHEASPIAVVRNTEGIFKISPRAKKLAERKGLNPAYAVGTGPEGRIIQRDIYALAEKGPYATKAALQELGSIDPFTITGTGISGRITSDDVNNKETKGGSFAVQKPIQDEYRIDELSNIRKIIANNMMQSLQNTAQLTLNASFDATRIMEYRQSIKNTGEEVGLSNITLNDMVMYAVSRTVGEFEYLNAHMMDNDQIKVFSNVHLGFACDTNKGLMVPTLFNADTLSLNALSAALKELAAQCQRGNIDPSKLQGATFTVSNLGSFGIEHFTPVINPPQTAILGVGTIEYKIKKVGEQFAQYPAMLISLTFDHRAVDGAPAARFIKTLKNNLENFNLLLAK